MDRPDYHLSAIASRFSLPGINQPTAWNPIHSWPREENCADLCFLLERKLGEEFVGNEHSFNSAAGRLKVGRRERKNEI